MLPLDSIGFSSHYDTEYLKNYDIQFKNRKTIFLINSIIIIVLISIVAFQVYTGTLPSNFFWSKEGIIIVPLMLISYLLNNDSFYN